MLFISLNAGRTKIVEADMIEESQEHLEKRLNNYFKTIATAGYYSIPSISSLNGD